MVLKQLQEAINVTVNQFNSSATQPTQPIPFLEAQQHRITFSGIPTSGEKYSIFLNGIEYSFTTTPTTTPLEIADGIADLINADTTSLVKDLFANVPNAVARGIGTTNFNGLSFVGYSEIILTANYDGNSAPAIPPGGPRGYGGDFELRFNVEAAPGNARAFGTISDIQLNQTSKDLCVILRERNHFVKRLLQRQILNIFQHQLFILLFLIH